MKRIDGISINYCKASDNLLNLSFYGLLLTPDHMYNEYARMNNEIN